MVDRTLLAALLAVATSGCATPRTGAPTLTFEAPNAAHPTGSVVVQGVPDAKLDAARALLVVRTQESRDADGPAIFGTTTSDGGVVRYEPRFAFLSGVAYHAEFRGTELGLAHLARTFHAAVRPGTERAGEPAPRVVAVHPSGARVPANLLRMYVTFSEPMRARDIHAFVRVLDDDGAEVEQAFVEFEHGIWDDARRRLTLLFHPGRLKRGVGPNLRMGPPLEAGRRYTLVIDDALRDELGRPLGASFEKSFVVEADDRSSPDPRRWTVTAPVAAGAPLDVALDEPLDHALLSRMLTVTNVAGEPVVGDVRVGDGETRWTLAPKEPWRAGEYILWVDPALEDLAGNTPGQLFDRGPIERSASGAPRGPFGMPFSFSP